MTDTQEAINVALSHSEPRDVIEGVKAAIADELSEVSRRFVVRTTNYFNHGFFPDLVAWWGSKDSDRREIFLRFDVADTHVAEDIARLGREDPLFFSLKPRPNEELPDAVSTAIQEQPTTLVATIPGVDAITGTKEETFSRMIAEAVVQGGRGYMDEAIATDARETSAIGVEAAVQGDVTAIRRTVSVANQLLGRNAPRIEKYLQVLWMAGGRSIDNFPGDQSLVLDIDSRDISSLLRVVLSGPDVQDADFWKRLASRTDLGTLEGLQSAEPSRNLQSLMVAAQRLIEVSHAAVDLHPPRMATISEFEWRVSDHMLRLDSSEALLTFTADGRHFNARRDGGALLDPDAVRSRTEGFHIERIGVDEEEVVITVAQKPDADRAGVVLERLTAEGERQRVRDVTLTVAGRSFNCHFERGVGGLDNGTVALADLAEAAGCVLAGITGSNREDFRAFLRS